MVLFINIINTSHIHPRFLRVTMKLIVFKKMLFFLNNFTKKLQFLVVELKFTTRRNYVSACVLACNYAQEKC